MTLALTIAMCAAIVPASSIRYAPVPVTEIVAQSDFIGVVSTIREVPLEGPEVARGRLARKRVAEVFVRESLKGPPVASVLEVEFTEEMPGRGVLIIERRVFLAFLSRIDEGRYELTHPYYGDYTITEDRVFAWKDKSFFSRSQDTQTIDSALEELRAYIAAEEDQRKPSNPGRRVQ